ncbi:MAG: tetratricopeptide repeat protein [Candidatus Krumholzibacteria bacterium]|nr:tetratricopeptide repeat protein [Candidatus Krumholzibacteria bacterium]
MSAQLTEISSQARRYGLCGDWQGGPELGAVLVSGADSATFLHAQLTSDVLALGPGEGQLSARLNRQGQLLAWFSLHRLPDRGQPYSSFLLLLPASECDALVADLQAFVISEDALVEDMTAEFGGLVVQQSGAEESRDPILAAVLGPCPVADCAAWMNLPENSLSLVGWPGGGEGWIIRRALTGDPGYVILLPGAPAGGGAGPEWEAATTGREMVWLDNLDRPDARMLWRWLQAEAGWPRLGVDLPAGQRVLPQTGLDQQVVSFTKGCYLGQEVVARIRTYGSVPEALRAVVWQDVEPEDLADLPAAGAPCTGADEAKLGTWAGSFWAPVLQRAASLVFLKREHRTPGAALLAMGPEDELPGEVALLPLHMGANAAERAAQLHDQALHHFSAGRDEQAVTMLEDALRLDPTRAEAFEALGVILGRLNKYHEAIDIFRRLEEVAPEEPMVHTNLSLFYMQIGEKEEAEHQKALGTMKKFGVGVNPEQAAAMAAQERQVRQQDAERKKVMFAEVLDIDPDDALALMGMGQALDTLDEPEAAAEYLQRALVQQDQNSPLYASLGRVLEKLERQAEAADVFTRGIAVASRKGDLMPLKEMEHRLRLLDL